MNVLNKIEIKAKKAADLIEFTVEYTPGVTEDLDLYCVKNSNFGVSSYGPTEESARESAKIQLESILLENSSVIDLILKAKN
jgi:hypothetical protein